MMMRTLGASLTIAACLVLTQQARARDGCTAGKGCVVQEGCGTPDCCAACGCRRPCRKKVCQVVCGTKTVMEYCWEVECEEFCAPLPGCGPLAHLGAKCRDRCCDRCGDGSGDGCCDSCGDPSYGKECGNGCLVPPKCGPVRCRKKLVKKEYEREVPVYECVVKYLCPGCCDAEEAAPEPEQAPASTKSPPPAPAPDPYAFRPPLLPRMYNAP